MTKKLMSLVDFLKLNWLKGDYKISAFKDVGGIPRLIMQCPRCGALVGEPTDHYNWHKEMGR
jgi:hypothetical protein